MRWNLSRKSNKEEIGIEENEGKRFHENKKRIYNQLVVEKQSFQRLTRKFQDEIAGETAEKEFEDLELKQRDFWVVQR